MAYGGREASSGAASGGGGGSVSRHIEHDVSSVDGILIDTNIAGEVLKIRDSSKSKLVMDALSSTGDVKMISGSRHVGDTGLHVIVNGPNAAEVARALEAVGIAVSSIRHGRVSTEGRSRGGGEGEVASASTIDSSLPLISRLKTHYQSFSVSTLFVKEPTELETFYQQIELVRDREYRKATHRERDRLEHAALGAAECDVGVTTAALRGLDERTHPDAMGSGRAKLEEDRLFTGGDKPIQKLLVLGEAGMGKTTWSKHIAAEWAKGAAWLSQFDVVLCIPCFEIRDWLVGKAAPLEDEEIWLKAFNLRHRHLSQIESLLEGEESGACKVLYILDGWDELGPTEDAPLLKSTAAYLLAKPHVIVTTRPQAVPDLRVRDREVFRADREIRLLGFNSKAQAQFAHTYFDILVNEDATTVYSGLSEGGGEAEPREKSVDEYASEFQGLLNTQQSLKHLTSNPVLLEILCYAHFDPKGTSLAADSTFRLTPLYQNVIERVSRRLLERIDIKAVEHRLIEDKPFREHPYAALCLKALKAICFETWQQNQPIIASKAVLAETSKPEHQSEAEALSLGTRKDLPNHYALLTRDFGLMEVIKADRRTRVATAWRIKHYSIHEYFAAEVMLERLLAARPEDRQALIDQWVEQYKANQSSRVWIFITGMLAQQATAHRDVEAMLQYWVKGFLSYFFIQVRNAKPNIEIDIGIDHISHPMGLFHQSYFPLLKEISIALFPSWELSTLLPKGMTPELLLVTAAGSEALDWLRYVHERGCGLEIELKYRFGTTKISAFHMAAVYGDLQAMKQLIDWSGDLAIERILGKRLYDGNTLALALREGHDAVAQYGLEVFKDRGMSDSDYQEVLVDLLERTMASASIEMLDNLFGQLEEGLQRQIMNDSMQAKRAWITAAENNHRDNLQWMLAHDMVIDQVGSDGLGYDATALSTALSKGNIELADWLIERGASFDPKSEAAISAWLEAAKRNHLSSLQCMLAHGMAIDQVAPDVLGYEMTALTAAFSQGHLKLFDWLIERGAGFDPKSEAAVSVWISAAENNYRDHLQWMLARGMPIDQVGRNWWHHQEVTGLTVALNQGHIELADWLIEQGAVLDLESEIIRGSFLECARYGTERSVKWYLEHGVRPTETDFSGVCEGGFREEELKHNIQQLMIDHGFPKPPGWDESRGRDAESSEFALLLAAAPEDEVEERDSSTAPS